MVSRSFNVDEYNIVLFQQGKQMTAKGTYRPIRAAINCKGKDINKVEYCCFITFLPEGAAIPEASYDDKRKVASLYLCFSDIGPFMDMLRNANLISASVDSDDPSQNWLRGSMTK